MTSLVVRTLAAAGAVALIVGCSSSDDDASGGDPPNTLGGDGSSGGGTSGTVGSSGAVGTSGGTSGSSGGGDGGSTSGGCGGSAADPAAATTVSGYMDKLKFNAPTGAARAEIIDAILKSCEVFGPRAAIDPGWDRKFCWAHLVSAISKESSYNATSTVKDAYGTRNTAAGKANNPTVGLLQVRFSSTVRDYTLSGNAANLSCAGCTFPAAFATHKNETGDSAFWAVNGPTQNLATMTNVACNVALGSWYYYFNATGNGKPTAPTYIAAYCKGQGTAGNLITGLLSHLQGAENGKGVIPNLAGLTALQGTNVGAYNYVTEIKTMFDTMVGAVPGTHPFFIKLSPNTTQYCQ